MQKAETGIPFVVCSSRVTSRGGVTDRHRDAEALCCEAGSCQACPGAASAAVSTALGPRRLRELLGAHRWPCGLPAALAGTPRPSLGQRLLEKGSAAQNQLRFPAGQFLLL